MASSAPTAVLSYVVGYFNPNSWPVVINISSVNVNFTLEPKAFVTLGGRKVNDPLLEKYVGPDMLAKQTTKDGVPLVLFPRVEAPQISSESSVRVNPTVDKDPRGFVQDSSFDKMKSAVAVGNSSGNSIRVYTRDEAVKKGIIRPIVDSPIEAPKETDGQPSRLDNIPRIEDTMPREVSPQEAKKIVERLKKEQPDPELDPAPSPENEKTKAEGFSSEEIKLRSDALLKAMGIQESSDDPETKKDAFVCKADGKTFSRKGYLLNYVRKHYPKRVDELMAGY